MKYIAFNKNGPFAKNRQNVVAGNINNGIGGQQYQPVAQFGGYQQANVN